MPARSTSTSAEVLFSGSGTPLRLTSASSEVLYTASGSTNLSSCSVEVLMQLGSLECNIEQAFSLLAEPQISIPPLAITCSIAIENSVKADVLVKTFMPGVDISINSPDISGIACLSSKSLSSLCSSRSISKSDISIRQTLATSSVGKLISSTLLKSTVASASSLSRSKSKATISAGNLNSNSISKNFSSSKLSIYGGLAKRSLSTGKSTPILSKYFGVANSFQCVQKLYPTRDIQVSGFVGSNGSYSELYELINEGSVLGKPFSPFGEGALIFDADSFIQPSSIQTSGRFFYKCEVSKPIAIPEYSSLRISASAPIRNYVSKKPPRFSIEEAKLEDPSGNLIIRYSDISFYGDANHYSDYSNYFTTYFLSPAVNNARRNQWDSLYPLMNLGSGYSLSFFVRSENLDDPFDKGFDSGFQEYNEFFYTSKASGDDYLAFDGSPLSTQSQGFLNPSHSLKITAIEICNSGRVGPGVESYIPIFTQVVNKGNRIERRIYPTSIDLLSAQNGIYPSVSSVWSSSNSTYSLTSTSPIADSGKLTLKFEYRPTTEAREITPGAFYDSFDESTYSSWINPSGAFNTQNSREMDVSPDYFDIESVYLSVRAKKAPGSRDFSLDVVGYSDDGLLNVTNAVGGFLQNIQGVGSIPQSSGFNSVDDLAIGGESLSNKDQFYKTSLTNNDGGDHYLLSNHPVIRSTEYQWYEIPLKVYDDRVSIGKSRDYSLSSFFEKLYLDVYPIPSGASISDLFISVRYNPQNAIALSTQGSESIAQVTNRSELRLFPSGRKNSDPVINSYAYGPLSKIERTPQGFIDFSGVKTNYSRRWRALPGLVQGAFDVNQFDFGFNNPLLDSPFVYGYYDFTLGEGHTVEPNVGSNVANMHLSHGEGYRYDNIGWRFSSNDIFTSELPGFSGAYKTTDWTSLSSGASNFLSHPLYGKISDAFSSAMKTKGHEGYIDFGRQMQTSGGFSAYIRFTPNVTYSGVNYNLFNSGVLVSKWGRHNHNQPRPLEFVLGYESGYLCAIASDVANNLIKVKDTVPYSGYQYPLSVILTYNDNESKTLKLYADNELNNNWQILRASSVPFNLLTDTSDILVGFCPGSGIGMNMFVSEFGLSDSGNVVYDNPNLQQKEATAEQVFEEIRVKWLSSSNAQDSSAWSYLDEDISKWTIGDFKYCDFSPAFSQLTKRVGRDLVAFDLKNNGLPYSSITNISLPSGMSTSVSYHSQIENSFFRLFLSDSSDKIYSARPRISKSLPVGYKFADTAIAVDSVLEHESSGAIKWADGKIGPKLIVSLYTRNQQPYWHVDGQNWGLVNRYYHYLEPSSCMVRLTSKFDYNSLLDESELWALFPDEPRVKEFSEKYFSEDLDDMYLQYDIVYPSGSPYRSRINLHSVNIRLDDALVNSTQASGFINLATSGNPSPVNNSLNLYSENNIVVSGSVFNLYAIGPIQVQQSGLSFYTSGALIAPATLPLALTGLSGQIESINLFASGGPERPTYGFTDSLNLSTLGKGIVTSSGGNSLGLSLVSYNAETAKNLDPNILSLYMYGSSGNTFISTSIPFFIMNDIDEQSLSRSGILNISSLGSSALISRYSSASLNLFTFNNNPQESLSLTLFGDNLDSVLSESSLNLFTVNYGVYNSPLLNWFNNNYGYPIDLDDNVYASIPVGSEIRGVDLIGYGSCTGDSPRKAIDKPLITHDTLWRAEFCNDGGIFRAIETYSNESAGYSGNYYGIRKYAGLVPGAPYDITVRVKTGDTSPITVPREWQEWEYGANSTINYSGIKLVGDYQYGLPSGRNADDRYGYKVVTKSDLMAVSAPFREIPDESGIPITNAGSVFLYRRGEDLAGQKAAWNLQEELILPSGFRRDYISQTVENLICYPDTTNPEFCVSGQKWSIGQQGREFGYSVDLCSSGNREVVVVGAPGAYWDRKFEDINSSGIPVCMLVITDKFDFDIEKISAVKDVARKWDVLYRYFSAPWAAGFQPYIDIKLLVCQLAFSDSDKPVVSDSDDLLYHTYLERLDDKKLIDEAGYSYVYNSMASGIRSIFNRAFLRDTSKPHFNIPPIVGVFEDNSPSTTYKAAFKPVIDGFLEYYSSFAFASGVVDPVNPASGYINRISDASELWDAASISLMNETLSSGNLITNDALKYITSGVGQQWARTGAYEFQIPPGSGGRVFIFENENGQFNLVQEISSTEQLFGYESPTLNRFGHSTSISANGEVIAVGSPYSLTPCLLYERDESENQRLLSNIKSWLQYKGMSDNVSAYNNVAAQSGLSAANLDAYIRLSKSDKFLARKDENFWSNRGGSIKLYKNIYSYSYQDIPYTGTWGFLAHEYAPTSRLGYSSAVSEDGNLVAFGAPTDSFNQYDDFNMWGQSGNTWASYVNAGAVRLFESRKYYPHNLAVEFYRFGNLDRNSHPELSEYYNQLELYFSSASIPFRRTGFEEIEIPREAGLAFIITPELDATSDEIVDNIKSWLSLGDRTLVLVGNDPVWEDNGRYKRSNDIINKLLKKLGSKMTLVAARNEYESLPNCVNEADVNDDKYNVTASFVPSYAHQTNISNGSLFAKGVADIKIDLSSVGLSGLYLPYRCTNENPYCEMPLADLGDLRAEWTAICEDANGSAVSYKINWPYHFGNDNPAKSRCLEPATPLVNRENQEPRPILTAAEWTQDYQYVIPARSGSYKVCEPIFETVQRNQSYFRYSENHINEVAFSLQEGADSTPSGNFINFNQGTFFDPPTEQGRDGLIQATGTPYALDAVGQLRTVDSDSTIVSYDAYQNSSVVLIASVLPESSKNTGYGSSQSSSNTNNDENIFFYNNLVMRDCNNAANIYQLGGWTGRTSFQSAFYDSQLTKLFEAHGHYVTENFDATVVDIPQNADVLWIARPVNKPSAQDLNKIKAWLAIGGKRLVVTYAANQKEADNVKFISEYLEIGSSPFYSASEAKFLEADLLSGDLDQYVNESSDIISGCENGYSWLSSNFDSSVSELSIQGDYSLRTDFSNSFIPIKRSSGLKIVSVLKEIKEIFWTTPYAWKIDASGSASFSGIPGSGYRMFINWVSESPEEKYEILARLRGVTESVGSFSIGQTSSYLPEFKKIDFTLPIYGDGTFSIDFDTAIHFKIDPSEYIPKTPRLLSISGCLLPKEEVVSTIEFKREIGSNCVDITWSTPEEIITVPGQFRPIKTDSAKYCPESNCQGKLIEDGPVIVAEEFESFSSFSNGETRSRIVLISDSTIIQGQCPHYRNDAQSENQAFVRSLYPKTQRSTQDTNQGRKFNFTQKLIAPERGSPGKYYAHSPSSGVLSLFSSTSGTADLSKFSDGENDYNVFTFSRPIEPVGQEAIDKEKKKFKEQQIELYGFFPKFSGGSVVDAGIEGGIPQIMLQTGKDYLDLDIYPSGYKGDLFGYSIAIDNNKILVGTPFNAFKGSGLPAWSGITQGDSNLQLNGFGGAGAAFLFEKSDSLWEFTSKIKPSSVGVSESGNDKFGLSVSMDADFMAIGAPGHSYNTAHQHIYSGDSAFIRKEFDSSFKIPSHIFEESNELIYGNGAVYTLQNKILDWQSRSKTWQFAEKITAHDYMNRVSGEYAKFGQSVSINRSRRGDSDYTLAAGSPGDKFAISGSQPNQPLSNAGSAYTYDAMLRSQPNSVINSGGWIDVSVFGDKSASSTVKTRVYQNVSGDSAAYSVSGIIFANSDGEIFLEASGFDSSSRGFIAHRPFVESINGDLINGISVNSSISLITSGLPNTKSNSMNTFMLGDDSAIVYNNLNLSLQSWSGVAIGSGSPTFNLTTSGTTVTPVNSSMNITMSGTSSNTGVLNLRIRGK